MCILSHLKEEHSAPVPYLQGPATHTTGAGRVLDGVRDPTQGSASLAFGCIGPGLVRVLPAICHRCAALPVGAVLVVAFVMLRGLLRI
jgi:hypothetical protein